MRRDATNVSVAAVGGASRLTAANVLREGIGRCELDASSGAYQWIKCAASGLPGPKCLSITKFS